MELKKILMTENNKEQIISSMKDKGWIFVAEKRDPTSGELYGEFKLSSPEKKILFD